MLVDKIITPYGDYIVAEQIYEKDYLSYEIPISTKNIPDNEKILEFINQNPDIEIQETISKRYDPLILPNTTLGKLLSEDTIRKGAEKTYRKSMKRFRRVRNFIRKTQAKQFLQGVSTRISNLFTEEKPPEHVKSYKNTLDSAYPEPIEKYMEHNKKLFPRMAWEQLIIESSVNNLIWTKESGSIFDSRYIEDKCLAIIDSGIQSNCGYGVGNIHIYKILNRSLTQQAGNFEKQILTLEEMTEIKMFKMSVVRDNLEELMKKGTVITYGSYLYYVDIKGMPKLDISLY